VDAYAAQGSHPVPVAREALEAMGVVAVEANLLAHDGESARHDAAQVAAALTRIIGAAR
jgi:hypothetical protein